MHIRVHLLRFPYELGHLYIPATSNPPLFPRFSDSYCSSWQTGAGLNTLDAVMRPMGHKGLYLCPLGFRVRRRRKMIEMKSSEALIWAVRSFVQALELLWPK